MNGPRSALLALATFALAGCPSISTMGTARNVPEGTYQYFVAGGYGVLQDTVVDEDGNAESVSAPSLELGIRYGLSDRVEMFGKIFPVGAEVGTKIQVLRSATTDRGLDLAVAPSLSVYPWSKGVAGWGNLAIPVGFNVGGGSQLVLTPRATAFLITSQEGTGHVYMAGSSLGIAIPWSSRSMRIMPEVSVLVPLSASLPTDVESKFVFEGPVFQGAIGFLFGP